MIEMSVDKKTVLPQEGRSVGSHQQSTSSFNNNTLMLEETPVKHNSKDDGGTEVEMGSTANALEANTSDTKDLEKSDGHPQESNSGLQQNAQQPKLNKRRTTLSSGFKHPMSGKRRRRANSESNPVLPTNFLLGGNIFDPLNLNSLLDEEVNRALNAETPKSSPLPAKSREPVEILIPRDITDPLNLNSGFTGDAGALISPLKSGGRRRHRNRHHGGGGGGGPTGLCAAVQLELSEGERSVEGAPATAEETPSTSLPHPLSGATVGNTLPEGASLLNPLPSTGAKPATVDTLSEDLSNSSFLNRKSQAPQRFGGQVVAVGSDATLVRSSTGPAPPHLPTRQRKRRRVSSRSENSEKASSVPPAKHPRPERGREPAPVKHGQPFHTPVVGSGSRTISRRMHSNHRGPNQQPKKKFQYGNYTKYYGYRNPGTSDDPRMEMLKPEWFQGKTVLDLGCNTGHLTMSIAKQWRPSRIVGLDIDGGLIHAARQNIRYYLSEIQAREARRHGEEDGQRGRVTDDRKDGVCEEKREHRNDPMEEDRKERPVTDRGLKSNKAEQGGNGLDERQRAVERNEERTSEKKDGGGGRGSPKGGGTFPVSLRISRGPIAAPPLPRSPSQQRGSFPANVSFVTGNYVLEADQLLLPEKEEYDVILCLSVTKWVHLNWGDAGLKRLFRRAYRHLRPGGLLILEPQPWSSYGRKKRLTDTIYKNYFNIHLRPDQFSTYLTCEVGFSSYEFIGTPEHLSRGFQRPIYLFHKGPSSK